MERCEFCVDPRRDPTIVCVVEEPSAVGVLDRATGFRGRYHVLGGRLDPLGGIGPGELRLDELKRRVADEGIREIILATNPSMEGEVTATYIQQLLANSEVRVTRLARGLPVGGDLEYIDGVTLAHALSARQEVR
jgi:recombination protein RecR